MKFLLMSLFLNIGNHRIEVCLAIAKYTLFLLNSTWIERIIFMQNDTDFLLVAQNFLLKVFTFVNYLEHRTMYTHTGCLIKAVVNIKLFILINFIRNENVALLLKFWELLAKDKLNEMKISNNFCMAVCLVVKHIKDIADKHVRRSLPQLRTVNGAMLNEK